MRTPLLDSKIVLVLNRNWQAIHTRTPAEAFCQMATEVATALDILLDEEGVIRQMVPTKWEDWQRLPIREGDAVVGTARGPIRVPTVIVVANFAKVPKKRPRLNPRSLWKRDGGRCQYTGRPLASGEGNVDHVFPRSRGGETSWENCVLSSREVNSEKADRTPEEAGLRLLRVPREPAELPVTALLQNTHGIQDWEPFLWQS